MRSPTPSYTVAAELALPDFVAERTFLRTERQYVARRLEELAGGRSLAVDFGNWLSKDPGYKAWDHYGHELARYERRLAEHEQQIAGGLIPVKVVVRNDTNVPDRNIRVSVEVKDGAIHKAKKAPKRPQRIDSTEPMHWWRILSSGGFWRSGIRITGHRIEAKFSRLGGHDAAYIVNEPTYIETTHDTRLSYELQTHRLAEIQRGEVPLYE